MDQEMINRKIKDCKWQVEYHKEKAKTNERELKFWEQAKPLE